MKDTEISYHVHFRAFYMYDCRISKLVAMEFPKSAFPDSYNLGFFKIPERKR